MVFGNEFNQDKIKKQENSYFFIPQQHATSVRILRVLS